MIVVVCGFRGQVISQAGAEEGVIDADIGEWWGSLLLSVDSIDKVIQNWGFLTATAVFHKI